MHAQHFRTVHRPNEIFGGFALAVIGVALLFAFAVSPMGTLAAGIVAVVAYPLAGRSDTGSAPLLFVQRTSLAIATIGVGAAFLLF